MLKRVFSLLCFFHLTALGQQDDFEVVNEAWSRFDPIGSATQQEFASYNFENEVCRISTPTSPNPSVFGAARASYFRPDVLYSERFFLSVDLTIPDPSLRQAVGFLMFISDDPMLGEVNGYTVNYQPADRDLIINRITDEIPLRLAIADADAGVELSTELRLVVLYENGEFTALLFERDDLTEPVIEARATDDAYTSGHHGVFVFADEPDASGETDVIFDNYVANELTVPELSFGRDDEGQFTLSWPDWAVHYRLVSGPDLLSLRDQPFVPNEDISNEAPFFLMRPEVDSENKGFFLLRERTF